MPLSEFELNLIEQQLNLEMMIVKKYKVYASACTDQQLKKKCEQIAAQHQGHYTKLITLIN